MSLIKDISIIYEDEHILVINKPAGIAVHADGRTVGETLIDWILLNYPEIKGVGEPLILSSGELIERPGIVHRLDRETTGALIITKTARSFKYFKKLFSNREILKEYHTFVYGTLPKDFGTIDRPIGRSRTDFRKWSAEPKARGELREAKTYYEVVSRGDGFTFVRALPKTGRTHQIRVHFKAINHPIVSDSLYAPKREKILGFERTALHAFSLEFVHLNGKTLVINAPYPEDFNKALKTLNSN
jgi:23S rRNA pseudouridine1911/1915/1917 synthase